MTFSSVLEMMKERKLDAEQRYLFGDITVRATEHLFDDTPEVTFDSIKENADGK